MKIFKLNIEKYWVISGNVPLMALAKDGNGQLGLMWTKNPKKWLLFTSSEAVCNFSQKYSGILSLAPPILLRDFLLGSRELLADASARYNYFNNTNGPYENVIIDEAGDEFYTSDGKQTGVANIYSWIT